MRRILYRGLLLLHPPAFRRRFGAEMLCIFDEAGGGRGFFTDGLASLLRQWFVGAGTWKVALAIFFAFVQALLFFIAVLPRFQ